MFGPLESPGGRVIPDQFKDQCDAFRIAVGLRPFPNPGNPYQPMRLLSFRNYSNVPITVTQNNRKMKKHIMPANGTLEIMLEPGEQFPTISKG